MGRTATRSWQSEDDDDHRHLWQGIGCRRGKTAQCRESSGTPEHSRTGILSGTRSLWGSESKCVRQSRLSVGFQTHLKSSHFHKGLMTLCSDLWVARRRWTRTARTAVCPIGALTHQKGQNCSSRPCWPPASGLRSARLDAIRNVARYGYDALPRNMIGQWRRREISGLMVRSLSIWTPRSRTDVTGEIVLLPMRTGPVEIWCWRRCDEYHGTSALLGVSCSQLALIQRDTSSMQPDILSCKQTVSEGDKNHRSESGSRQRTHADVADDVLLAAVLVALSKMGAVLRRAWSRHSLA